MAQSGIVVLGVNVESAGPRLFNPQPVTQGVAQGGGRDSQNTITAATTQTLAGAVATAQLNYGNNDIAVCANANDAVALPAAVAGAVVNISNSGAQACKLFASGTDTINGTAGATGVTGPGAAKLGFAMCSKDGQWKLGITA